jgi:tetratricopeptide (TPR) repeat protein
MKGYTTADVARLLGLTAGQIRVYVRSGILTPERGPRGEYRFNFQDLVLLRTAAALSAARVPARRLGHALQRLRAQLPHGRSLTELRITAEGDEIVVQDGTESWNPESGQLVLDFRVAELAEKVAPLARQVSATAHAEAEYDADQWYQLGLELEAVTPDEARAAYERVVELEPEHADAHVNLGRLLHEAGRTAEAAAHYRRALATGPHAVASFNLGVALEDLQHTTEAVEAYRRALAADDSLAEAHYNLARLYERAGDAQAALRHYQSYRNLTGGPHSAGG